MQIHHDKHHAAYVNNLNAALEPHPDLQKKSLEELIATSTRCPRRSARPVRNNGGGHVEPHDVLGDDGARRRQGAGGALADAITKAFGGLAQFKEQFAKACVGRFGSGWGWLIADKKGGLSHRQHAEPGQPAHERQDADPRLRRLGARLLPEVPEPPARLRRPPGGTWSTGPTSAARFDQAGQGSLSRPWPRFPAVGSPAPDFTLAVDRRKPT